MATGGTAVTPGCWIACLPPPPFLVPFCHGCCHKRCLVCLEGLLYHVAERDHCHASGPGERREFHTLGRIYLSPVILLGFLLMWMASLMPCIYMPVSGTHPRGLTPSQSMTWLDIAVCAIRVDLYSVVLESFLCCWVNVLV